jgi:hypothetical protein
VEPVPGDATPAVPRPRDVQAEVHLPHSPVSADPDGVRLEPRRTGHRLLDFAVAGSAILISLISLGVAIHLGQVQQRLVAANSWPFLQFASSYNIEDGKQVVSIGISNDGAGAAILKSLVVRYQGKVIRGYVELLQACCGLRQGVTKTDVGENIGVGQESSLIGVLRAREGHDAEAGAHVLQPRVLAALLRRSRCAHLPGLLLLDRRGLLDLGPANPGSRAREELPQEPLRLPRARRGPGRGLEAAGGRIPLTP